MIRLFHGLRRFQRLAGTQGLVRAVHRALRFVFRGSGGLTASLSAEALDPSDPSAVSIKAIGAAATNLLEPVTSLRQVLGFGASTCFVIRVTTLDRSTVERSIQSVLRQTQPNWEILLSPDNGLDEIVDEWLDIDWRIRRMPESDDDRPDLVRAALYATSDFVGVIEQGDIVENGLVASISRYARGIPSPDLIYTDESRISENGAAADLFHKPDWSPEHLTSVNYIGRFTAFRKLRLFDIDLEPTASVEARDYALLLEVLSLTGQVAHIDEALYVNMAPFGTRMGGFFSQNALPEARESLLKIIQRQVPFASVGLGRVPGSLQVSWPVEDTPVTLVILTGLHRRTLPRRGEVVLVTHFVRSIIDRSDFRGYRILVVDDGEVPEDLHMLLTAHGHRHRSYPAEKVFSFAKKANFGVRLVDEGIVILLNDDLEVIDPGWIQAMVGLALRPQIGAVGARLLHGDGSIQHAGIALGYHGAAGHILHRAPADGSEYGGFASITRNVSAVTGAAMAFRRSTFDELGGFDERLNIDYNDVDFCLRLAKAGYRVAVSPTASLYHFHNSSLKRPCDNPDERQIFVSRWRELIARDPYYSRHFQRQNHDLPLLAHGFEHEDGT